MIARPARSRDADSLHAPPSGGIRAAAVRGFLSVGAGRAAGVTLDQLFALALARLLAPADFGLFALAAVFTSLFRVFAEVGLTRAIVQRPEIDDEYLSTAFWTSLVAGIALFGLSLLAGELIVRISGQPIVPMVVAALSLRFVLTAGVSVHMAILSRRLEFWSLSWREVAGALVGGIAGVAIAVQGGGVWALVGQAVATVGVRAALLWVAVPWRPSRSFSWAKFRDLWSFGGRLLSARLLMYLIQNTDNLLVGRFLGPVLLGYYALAYKILLFPLIEVGNVVGRVAFPALSKVSTDQRRLTQGFLEATRYVSFLLVPTMAGLVIVAPWFLEVVFSAKWLPAAGVLRLLAAAGIVQGITSTIHPALQAAGRPDLQLRWTLAAVAVYLPGFAIGLRWGIEGVAAGFLVVTVLLMPLQFRYLATVMPVRPADVLHALRPALTAAAVLTLVLAPLQSKLARAVTLPSAVELLILLAVGAAVYAVVALFGFRRELGRALHDVLGRRTRATHGAAQRRIRPVVKGAGARPLD